MGKKQPLRQGEKILFGIFGAFMAAAVLAYIGLEMARSRMDRPMFPVRTHYNLSEEGRLGSVAFRKERCTDCHRAMRNGTNMGLDLDGIGSRRSKAWLLAFLKDPEKTYGAPTVDHGAEPKEAAYVARLPEQELERIATFLSELKADRGSAAAPEPPPGRSTFIDSMVKVFAPEEWKQKYRDVRQEAGPGGQQAGEAGR
ncbi:MAG: hypothetical protein D6809_05290 [Gammaproteobacteria bacterium]|nr:MAG: hypothetical protein D6809_05290 [Gammaproteobacteria bacterium]